MAAEAPKIFWAKIPGFAPWPARYCSKLETIDLRKRATPKGSQVATVFLERKMKRGWVSGANIEGFKLDQIIDPSGGGLFSLKSFDSNPNYRLSIMEAVRITYSQINNDPNMSREEAAKAADVYQQITSLIHKHEPGFPLKMREARNAPPTSIEICELCHGTCYSGELRSCSVTEDVLEDAGAKHCSGEGRIHFHCLQPNEEVIDPDERWYCAVCCENYGWQPNALLPADYTLLPFFGTVERYLPASIASPDDQLYHVVYDDGDEEDYTLRELQVGMNLYDKFKGPGMNQKFRSEMFATVYVTHHPDSQSINKSNKSNKKGNKYTIKGRAWTAQHNSVGVRVCKYFVGEMAAPTLHANNVRNGKRSHVYADDEGEGEGNESREIEIKTEMEINKEEEEAPAGFFGQMERSQRAVQLEEMAIQGLSEPPKQPALHAFVSNSAGNFAESVISSASSAVSVLPSNASAFSRQDKAHSSGLVSAAASAISERAGRRTAILLEQVPRFTPDKEDLKAKLRQLNIEKQAAAKRQLQSSSKSNNTRSEESAASAFKIRKKRHTSIEEAEISAPHSRGGNSHTDHNAHNNHNISSQSSSARSRGVEIREQGASRQDTVATASAPANDSSSSAKSTLSLAPAETANHTGNIKVVHFIDQCLSIMRRHQQNMISARKRVLLAYAPMETEFSHNLVEALAADIVQIISPSMHAEILSDAHVQAQPAKVNAEGASSVKMELCGSDKAVLPST